VISPGTAPVSLSPAKHLSYPPASLFASIVLLAEKEYRLIPADDPRDLWGRHLLFHLSNIDEHLLLAIP
jgi:hypothetical protein